MMTQIFDSQVFTGNIHLEKSKVDFYETVVVDSLFDDYVAEGASLSGGVFVECSFRNADFYWGQFFCATFIRCEFENVDFRGGNMKEAVFVGCRLLRCDFSNDNLGGETDLSTVTFHDTTRIECRYSTSGK
jgi:uncharacterized protein YjbI with pentapeptide repeats